MFTDRRNPPLLARLAELELFADSPRAELAAIDRLATSVRVPSGRTLCRRGAIGRESYVVVSGEAAIEIGGTEVATVGPGAVVGEIAILDGGPRTATVTTRTPVEVLVFSAQDFRVMLDTAPVAARRILRALASRLRVADRSLAGG